MEQTNSNSFLKKLETEIVFIRSFLYSRIPQDKKDEFHNLEKIYESIALQIKANVINEELAPSIYTQFLKTLKAFKRSEENKLKYNERDVDAFLKKYEETGLTLLPLIHDMKMNMNERMPKFEINKILDFNFNMHLYTNKELADISFQMFEYANIHSKFNIDDSFLKDLIEEICMHYNVIPYHNWTHAFQLSQMFFTAYFTSEFQQLIDPFEFFVGLLSGLAHDMNHKGVNNLYKVKRKSENSLRYVELAVLENMHISTFFQIILRKPKFDIVSKFQDNAKANKFKRLMISNIISTDMGRHSQFIDDLKTKTNSYLNVKKNPTNPEALDKYLAFNREKESDREFLTNIMVHACDIGNPCYTFDNYMNWCYLLSQEFHDQTIKEEQKGLPVTTFLQYTGKQAFRNGQIFFSRSLLMPLWKELGNLMPELQVLPNQLNKNILQIEEDLKNNK